MKTCSRLSAFLAVALLTSIAGSTHASLVLGNATLNGAQETTPSGSFAVGASILNVDTTTGLYDFTLYVSGISSSSLMGVGPNLSPIHLHSGLPGNNGPIVIDAGWAGTIAPLGPTGFTLTVIGGTFGGVQGALTGPSVAANLSDLLAGKLYVNVHTTAFSGGEIRGQITPLVVPEPASLSLGLLGLSGLGLVLYRRRRKTVA